jgi:hypothetical protein
VHLALERGHSVTTFNRGRTEPRMWREDFEHVETLIGDRDPEREPPGEGFRSRCAYPASSKPLSGLTPGSASGRTTAECGGTR